MKAHDFLDLQAQRQPNAEFAGGCGQRITYAQARETANRIGHGLIAAGLEPGDRIAIVMKNSIETVLLYFAAFKVGVVPTPISHRFRETQWRDICNDAGAKLLVCDAEAAQRVDAIRDELKTAGQWIINGRRPLWTNWADWISQHRADDPPRVDSSDLDALQMYTSGTTGKARGVVLTHQALVECIGQLENVVRFRPSDRFLLVMPLFHAAGTIAMLQAVAGGASLLVQSGFEPTDVIEALDTGGVSVTMLAPTMIEALLSEVPDIAGREFKDLRLIVYGASPIHERTLRRAMDVFGCDFAQRYGSTETLCLTWLDSNDHRRALETDPDLLQSAGRPLPGVRIRVVDSSGHEVAPGEQGELIAAGPQLMREYWKLDDDASMVVDGERWFRTGDWGFKDADDYVFLCDRINDVIISGGENIHPREIEDVLLQHPEIREAAVIGIPDPKWGEAVKAIVVRRAGSGISAEDLIAYCRDRLARFEMPHSVDFVAAIPRNPSGKVLRYQLREPYWQGHPRRI